MAVRLWVYGPLFFTALAGAAFSGGMSVLGFIGSFTAGVAVWTILEYLIHRFAFHGFAPHWQHHADPVDPVYILAPLWLSVSASAALWGLLWLLTGSPARGALTVAGIIAGYIAYELVHLAVHDARRTGLILRLLRKHHFYHHFADDRFCYGVTSPLWDVVFRSLPAHRRAA